MQTPPATEEPLLGRYLKHVDHAERANGARRVFHIAAARGLYRLMADREIAGGEAAPMGMPHLLCISDAELRGMICS